MNHLSDSDFQRAVATARFHQGLGVSAPEEYAIHYVSEWGPDGGHYEPGYRVFPAREQEPGGMLQPSTSRPGTPVAIVSVTGAVQIQGES
jgi:hypothetical protein